MTTFVIDLVKDFHPNPYGRYSELDGMGAGDLFRKNVLAPALRRFDKVHVNLDGYNRYGRSFLDEAFGGLVREENFSPREVLEKLTYSHSKVKTIELVIQDRIEASIKHYKMTKNA
jgi:hypothetical protein